METNYVPTFEQFIIILALIHAGLVTGAAVLISISYAKHRSTANIALVAFSYVLLTLVTVSSVVWTVFAHYRPYALAVTLVAFTTGEAGLYYIWKLRKHAAVTVNYTETLRIHGRKIEEIEAALRLLTGVEE